MTPPCWEHWRRMPQAELWVAVALSCNVDPQPNHTVRTLSHLRAACFAIELEEFDRRMDVALAHIRSGTLQAIDKRGPISLECRVALPTFAQWASSTFGADVPAEFSEIAAQSPVSEAFAFDPDSDTYPEELDIAFTAWRAASQKPEPDRSPKTQILDWLEKHNKDLSREAKDRIAIVCNWNRKGGKPRGR